jgi:hypothetical protein
VASLSKFMNRYFWQPIQRFSKIDLSTSARALLLRDQHDNAMYLWSQNQEKVVLVAGHTHRPVFRSESQEEVVRKSLREAEEKLMKDHGNTRMQQLVAELAAELERLRTLHQLSPKYDSLIEFKKPSYFNPGCCAFPDGEVTGLEFSDGEIRLVRWRGAEDRPLPKVLAKTKVRDVFEAYESRPSKPGTRKRKPRSGKDEPPGKPRKGKDKPSSPVPGGLPAPKDDV